MRRAPEESLCANPECGDSLTTPLAVWLLVQLAALAVCAARVPLWADGAEAMLPASVHIMLAAQASASAMMFPVLMRRIRAVVATVIVSVPFQQLAGMLAQTPASKLWGGVLLLLVWLLGLALWHLALSSVLARQIGCAMASCIACGVPALLYLHIEFSNGEASTVVAHLIVWAWVISGAVAISGMVAVALHAAPRGSYPHVVHNPPTMHDENT